MMIVGIDPGLNGGLAWTDGEQAGAIVMPCLAGRPDLAAIIELLLARRPQLVVIEIPETRVGEGAASGLTAGVNWGLIVGLLHVMEYRREEVRSSAWKKSLGLPTATPKRKVKGEGEEPETEEQKAARLKQARTERKALAIALAERLFPAVSLIPSPKHKVRHDGLAEALLIAEYGRRLMLGRSP